MNKTNEKINKDKALISGVLAHLSNSGEVSIADIMECLHDCGADISETEVQKEIKSILASHKWFGLAWKDAQETKLSTIAGVRWFCESSMYNKLVWSKPTYANLTEQFVEALKNRSARYTNPRLLVDAGSTVFHSLFHEDDECKRLRKDVASLMTNNLFVALRYQEEFGDQLGKVELIGGAPHLDTAATVDHEKLSQWIGAAKRKPEISLLSWHYVKPEKAGKETVVKVWTKNQREIAMKKAIMAHTKGIIYIICSQQKITKDVPIGGGDYDLANLIKAQKENKERDVYFITDIGENPTTEQQDLLKYFKSDELKKHRVWIISPYVDTRPEYMRSPRN